MKLVAGSYERFLWGWRVQQKHSCLEPIFSYPAHLGPIKCISSWGPVLATGGSDDTIKIFDTNAQKDMGTLIHHMGAVNTLCFYGPETVPSYPSNLLSGSDDGTVCIWDTESWVLDKTMKGHKKGVLDLSIHPSGRLCLSVGRDSHLNMYDLLKGRRSFTSKLLSEPSLIRFSPQEGLTYSICFENTVIIHTADGGRPVHSLPHEKRVLSMAQQEDNLLFTGGEDRTIRAWDARTGKVSLIIENAHANRIRGLAVWETGPTSIGSSQYLSSASSDGCIRVWDARFIAKPDASATCSPLMEAETKARLTCLVACSLRRCPKASNTDEGDITILNGHTSTEDVIKRPAAETKSLKTKKLKKR